MLRVLFNGKELVLTNSTVINYTIKSPVFNTRDGAAVYKFKVSDCPENHQVFAFQFRQERFKTETVKGTLNIVFGSTTIFSGIGYAVGMKKGEIEVTGGIGKGELYSNFKDTYLDEIELGDPIEVSNPYTDLGNFCEPYSDANPFVLFPIYNPGFYDNYTGTQPYNMYQNPVYDPLDSSTSLKVGIRAWTVITPFFYVPYILKCLFKAMGMDLYSSDLYTADEYKNLCQYTPIAAGEFDGSLLLPFSIRMNQHMPHVKVLEYIKAIEYKINLFHFANHSTRKVKGVFFRSMLETNDFILWENGFTALPEYDWEETKSINLAYKVDSNDTLFAQRVTSIYANDKRVLPPVNSFSELFSGEQGHMLVRFNKENRKWYICRRDPATLDWTWVVFSWDFQDYKVYGESENTIEVKSLASGMTDDLGLINSTGGIIGATHEIYVPSTRQKGFSYVHVKYNSLSNEPIAKPDFGLRLFIFRGYKEAKINNGYTNLYPFGSSDVYHHGPSGLVKMEDANKAIRFQNEYGLVENEYATTLAWLKSRQPATFYRRFTVAELVNLDMSMKYRIDRQDYILEEVSGAIGPEGLRPAKVKAWKAL